MDSHSLLESETQPVKLIFPQRTGEICLILKPKEGRTDGGHRFHYLYHQQPDEVMLIKIYDSKIDGRATRTPHSAFVDEEYNDLPGRESIEVRALAFHEDDREDVFVD